MKKTYTEEQLRALATETFAQHPTAQKVFATTDGNVFLMENRARLHAGSGGKVLPIDRPETRPADNKAEAPSATTEAKTYPMNATKTAKAAAEAATLADLEPFNEDERKTVIDAVAKRRAELTPSVGLTKDGKDPENRDPKTDK